MSKQDFLREDFGSKKKRSKSGGKGRKDAKKGTRLEKCFRSHAREQNIDMCNVSTGGDPQARTGRTVFRYSSTLVNWPFILRKKARTQRSINHRGGKGNTKEKAGQGS